MVISNAAARSDTAQLADNDNGLVGILQTMPLPPVGKDVGFSRKVLSDIKASRYADAIAGLQKALSIRKKHPSILRWLVVVANDADDLFMAARYARKLVEVEPGTALNHVLHGAVLDRLGRLEEAVKAYQKANYLQPKVPKTLIAIGRAYATNGDHDKAIEFYEQALAIEPDNDLALHNLAQARKYGPAEAPAQLEKINAAIGRSDNPIKTARLHFAAGKIYDDTKQYDTAFEQFRLANKLITPRVPRDLSVMFPNTRAAFPNRKYFEDRRGFGLATDRPIFIVGMPRSGTTLMESLCAAHQLVTAGDEQTALGSLASSLGRDTKGHHYKALTGSITAEHAAAFANAYLEHCAQTVGTATPYFTDKMPHNFINVGLIALLFPNARIIHCRRHPLDSCLSLYSKQMNLGFHQQYKGTLESLGEHYRGYLDIMEHWRQVLPGKMHEVMYDDLVINTELNARRLMDFIGLEWDDSLMDRSGSQKRVATASQWQVRQPIYQSAKGRWQPYEKHLGPLIEAIGRDGIEAYEAELAAIDGGQ